MELGSGKPFNNKIFSRKKRGEIRGNLLLFQGMKFLGNGKGSDFFKFSKGIFFNFLLSLVIYVVSHAEPRTPWYSTKFSPGENKQMFNTMSSATGIISRTRV